MNPSTAADRLVVSRERMRRVMAGASAPAGDSSGPVWLQGLKTMPGGQILSEAVGTWWAQHPLRLASMVAVDAAGALVRPTAQRHPLALVFGAFVVGGLFAWSRPWRWILTPALFAGLVPQLFSKAMALVPPRSWMAVLGSLVQEQNRSPTTPTTTPPPDVAAAPDYLSPRAAD